MSAWPSWMQRFFSLGTMKASTTEWENTNAGALPQAINRLEPSQLQRLQSLIERRQHLEIRLGDDIEARQSLLLAIDTQRSRLLLDEVFPAYDQALTAGQVLRCAHHLPALGPKPPSGMLLEWQARVIACEQFGSAPVLVTSLPLEGSMLTRPRRRHFRADFIAGARLTARVKSPLNSPWFVQIDNLGAGGLQFSTPGDQGNWLARGQILNDCHLHLYEGVEVHCRLRVRQFNLQRRPRTLTKVRCAFVDMQAEDQRRIALLIEQILGLNGAASEHAA